MIIPSNYGVIILNILFFAAILFAFLFIAGLLGLVLRRLLEQKAARKWQTVEKQAKVEVMAWLSTQNMTDQHLNDISRLPFALRLALFEGLTLMVKGDLAKRLSMLAEKIGIQEQLIKNMQSFRADHRAAAAKILARIESDAAKSTLRRALNKDQPQIAAICAEGLLEDTDTELALTVGSTMLSRRFMPDGRGKRAFRRLWRQYPDAGLDLALDNKSTTDCGLLLRSMFDHIGTLAVPRLLRHPALHDPSVRYHVKQLVIEKDEPGFRRLTQKITELDEAHEKQLCADLGQDRTTANFSPEVHA